MMNIKEEVNKFTDLEKAAIRHMPNKESMKYLEEKGYDEHQAAMVISCVRETVVSDKASESNPLDVFINTKGKTDGIDIVPLDSK
jgi:hypothetical protein